MCIAKKEMSRAAQRRSEANSGLASKVQFDSFLDEICADGEHRPCDMGHMGRRTSTLVAFGCSPCAAWCSSQGFSPLTSSRKFLRCLHVLDEHKVQGSEHVIHKHCCVALKVEVQVSECRNKGTRDHDCHSSCQAQHSSIQSALQFEVKGLKFS